MPDLDVVGFIPPDFKWKQMKAVWDACVRAQVDPPKDVVAFFNHIPPDDNGVTIHRKQLEACGAIKEYSAEMTDGLEVMLANLPADVKILRFTVDY